MYLAFPIQGKTNEHLLIWTTTPWTIPANIAVAVDTKLKYVLVEHQDKNYWVAQRTRSRIFPASAKIITTVSGKALVGLKYAGPFDDLPAGAAIASHDKFHIVVPTDSLILPITDTEGTGLVHTAVSAGTEDFKLGQKLGLPMIPVIADNADYLSGLGWLSGKNAKTHPQIILDYLKIENWILKIESYTHRYPACWRCKTELVWKVTDEWYIAMDKGKPSLRQRMKQVAKKIRWIPGFGLDRELDWLNNMHDWLISKKNRYWGLCLPIWECDQCGHFEVIGSKEELKDRVVTGWDEFDGKSPHKPQIDAVKIKCSNCHAVISRIEPVGNPWLDAGIISFSTLDYTTDKKYWQDWFPADFITESFPGQFKNWFYSLIAMATVLEDTPPFKTVLGYASLLAEDGRPMHKSWGNAVEFNEGAEKIGVDIMRWLYCRQNPTQNLLFGFNTAAEVKRQFHLLLWNSYRFFANYAALESWSPQLINPHQLTPLDQWILLNLDQVVLKVTQALDQYDAWHATQILEEFVANLSTWYIRRSRDRLGPTAPSGIDKSACYATLHTIFQVLSHLLAPFIPFIADAIYTNITGATSVHLATWPQVNQPRLSPADAKLLNDMRLLRQVVEQGHSARKQLDLPLRQPLADITISGAKLPADLTYLLLAELNVKNINWAKSTGELQVILNSILTPQLQAEGQARQIIRQIQQARKAAGTQVDEWVDVAIPDFPSQLAEDIKQQTLTRNLIAGPSLRIIRHP